MTGGARVKTCKAAIPERGKDHRPKRMGDYRREESIVPTQGQSPQSKGKPLDRAALVKAVDAVEATRGLGVALRRHDRMEILRRSHGTGANIVFELRERYVDPAYMQRLDTGRIPFKSAGTRQAGWSVLKPARGPFAARPAPARAAPPAPRPLSRLPNRRSTSVPTKEWASLGLNCAGAAIAWIGVVGTGALAPVTGGTAGFAAVVLYAGAAAGSAQCMASVYRVGNAARGRSDINDTLDANRTYRWSMLSLDFVGLTGVKGAAQGAVKTVKAMRTTGVRVGDLAARSLTTAQRAEMAAGLGLNTVKVGSRVINRAARQRLLDVAGAVLGVYSSYDGGVIHELVVWVVGDKAA